MLYAPALHEPLTDRPWDEAWVRDRIAAIVADADAAYGDLWPAHEWDGWQAAVPLKNLYVGAAGVVWALDQLRRQGHVESALDLTAVARRALDRFRAEPDYQAGEVLPPQRRSGLLCAETGIALVAWRLAPESALADLLLELVRGNVGNDANEIMWGVPGTLLAARAMHDWTGEARWADAVRESEEALRAAREVDGLWTQHLWGTSFRSVSAPHGLVGNVVALRDSAGAAEALRARATIEDGRANWVGGEPKLQWCVGAPGVVVHAAGYLDEELLRAGAELVWDAGPAGAEAKGPGICHGTSGNGYALLRTFERTGDELWLDRARAFGVHALEQASSLPGRYSLFTGGVGAALFAADCLDGAAQYPILERL